MHMAPLASAIVLNYKSYKDSIRCIEALLKASPPAPLSSAIDSSSEKPVYSHQEMKQERGKPREDGAGVRPFLEILLIDNHSDDASMQYLRNRYREHAQVRIIEAAKNLGYGQGNALAIAQTQSEFLLIINPDNELEPEGLQKMIETLQHDPSIGLVAPRLVHPDGTVRDSARRFPTILDILRKRTRLGKFIGNSSLITHHSSLEATDVDWVAGACFVMRKSLFEQLGGFDPRFFLFFEDTDLCRRIWQAGKRVVYLPSVTAKDRKERLSAGGLLSLFTKKTARIHLVSGARYFWKWRKKNNGGN